MKKKHKPYLNVRDYRAYLLAGTYSQYLYWCRINNYPPSDVLYIDSVEACRGRSAKAGRCFKYGTWYERDYRIEQAFNLMKLPG